MAQEYAIALVAGNKLARAALAAQLSPQKEWALQLYGDVQSLDTQRVDLILIDESINEERALLETLNKPFILLHRAENAPNPTSFRGDSHVKPLRLAALLTQIHALLRQFEASDEAVFTLGPYQFFPGQKLLRDIANQEIKLTDKESAILRYLLRHPLQAVSRETLLTKVWGYHSEVTTHTLETHIYRLRQKIEGSNLLLTEAGGYRLNLNVRDI